MSILPKIDLPIHTVKLPISGLTIKFRPYKVSEQKLLAMAKESDDKNSLIEAIKQVIRNCCLDSTDTDDLCLVDAEFLFYQLRARSEAEVVELKYRCENPNEEGKACNNIMHYDLNLLTDLEIKKYDVSDTIEVSDTVGIKLKHQRLELDKIGDRLATPEELLEIVARNIDFIYDEVSSYSPKDVPIQHIVSWLGELPIEKYLKIEEFFNSEPTIIKKLDIKCKKCGFDHKIEVNDIFDFFI